ncbi:MAG: phospholipid/cholesterol/gamma-HCH transport system ATP-binding protein [Polyangiales bacterium]|jgi:phospholipid/cholesterol/gamma-HCH transport system ATP-binding protein
MKPLFQLRGVKKSFDGVEILSGVDLEIRKREVITIIGLSGSGKSVLLKMLIGLIDPDEGEIIFDGENVTNFSEEDWFAVRKRVGISFQEPALFDSMDVMDNVKYGLREMGSMSEKDMEARVSESLTAVGLPGIEEMAPASLSGGMKKRVGLARAVALHPEAVIYDEPTEGLDPINVTRVNRLMLTLRDALDVTTIVATHNLKAAYETSDRFAFLHDGRIAWVGSSEEFVRQSIPAMQDFVDKAVFQLPKL